MENGVWRTINGTRVFIRTGELPADAIKRQKVEAAEKAARSAAGLSGFTQKPQLASDLSGQIPLQNGKPAPIIHKTVYHVTRRENAEEILKEGFDLQKVRPRWENDYAISTTNTPLPKAMEYFMPYQRGAQFDNEKFVVLEIKVQGRFYELDTDRVNFSGLGARGWTRSAIRAGWDGQMGANLYIYNPLAISSIREVSSDLIAEANEKLKNRKLK